MTDVWTSGRAGVGRRRVAKMCAAGYPEDWLRSGGPVRTLRLPNVQLQRVAEGVVMTSARPVLSGRAVGRAPIVPQALRDLGYSRQPG
jgi:hypothetical protein